MAIYELQVRESKDRREIITDDDRISKNLEKLPDAAD